MACCRPCKRVHAKTYPYARPTFYYTNGEPGGLAKQFLDFTISKAGQKIATQVGFRSHSLVLELVRLAGEPAGRNLSGLSSSKQEPPPAFTDGGSVY